MNTCMISSHVLLSTILLLFIVSDSKVLSYSQKSHLRFNDFRLNRRISNTDLYSTAVLDPNFLDISFNSPTGLLITESNSKSFCLLQHNVVSLRENCKKVSLLKEILSPVICNTIIRKAEEYAMTNGGWTANRHTYYPTTDLPLDAVFGKFSSIHGIVNGDILPEIASFFGLNKDFLSIGEIFIAKYEFGDNKQSGLGVYTIDISLLLVLLMTKVYR